jgi:hypothetical protein
METLKEIAATAIVSMLFGAIGIMLVALAANYR